MTNLEHLNSLCSHGARIMAGEIWRNLTEDFYNKIVAQCANDGFNALVFEMELPGINDEMGIVIWRDGHIDSGSMRSIHDCLAAK